MNLDEIKLPDRIVTENTRAEARRQLIEAIALAPIETQIAIVKALTELGTVYLETTAIRAHQDKLSRAIAYQKCSEEVGVIAGGVIASLQSRLEDFI
jgi:hypothetical protein